MVWRDEEDVRDEVVGLGVERDYDAEVEYRERCVDSLVNAILECRQFLTAKETLKIFVDAL